MSRCSLLWGLLFAWPLGAGCAKQSAVEYGEAMFSDPALSGAKSNVFSCATCHTRITDVGAIRPGYNLVNAVRRPSYWGGFVNNLFDAVNQCVKDDGGFMGGNGLSRDSDESRALFLYLESLDDGAAAHALPLTVVADIVDVPSGDATRGAATYKAVCATCHGDANTGVRRLSEKQSVIPKETIALHQTAAFAKNEARKIIVEKIRHGKFFMVPGDMPLFSKEAFTDEQVGDVLAYFEMFGLNGFGP